MNFHQGDVVRIGKGKVEYGVAYDLGNEAKVVSHNTGKAQLIDPARLVLVKSAEDITRDEAPETDAPLVSTLQPKPFVDETADLVSLEHIPGETRCEYFSRTGYKLDGRITNYGRDILAALQLKRNIFVGKPVSRRGKKGSTHRQGSALGVGRNGKGGDR